MQNLLYIDCSNSGIAGDMFLAALYAISEDPKPLDKFIKYVTENLQNVKIENARFKKIQRNGLFPFKLEFQFSESNQELHVADIEEHILKLCTYLQLSQLATNFAILLGYFSKWGQVGIRELILIEK